MDLLGGGSTRSSLLWYCEGIINEKRPKYLLLENVKNLVSKKFKNEFLAWLKILEDYGYENHWQVLNAKDYGVPQSRERVFVISILKDLHQSYDFPKPIPLHTVLKDLLDDDVGEKYYMTGEQVEKLYQSKFNIQRSRIQTGDVCRTLMAREYKGQVSVIVDKPHWLYGCKNSKTDEFMQSYKVYSKYALSPTVTTGSGGGNHVYVVDNEKEMQSEKDKVIRKLTPKECWRLMGFHDEDFEKAQCVNSNTQLYKQAGNSIVVPVLEGLFRNLLMPTN